jgi:hypothetical protein
LGQLKVTLNVVLSVFLLVTPVSYADTSIAVITVAGVVPSIFSVTSEAQQAELDLSPGVFVSNKSIGLLHFRYNESLSSLTIASSTSSGFPEDISGNPYQFGGSGDFKVSFQPTCSTVANTYYVPFALTTVGTDVKSAASSSLTTTGVEEYCQVYASYQGMTTTMPTGGRFEMKIVVTMVSI